MISVLDDIKRLQRDPSSPLRRVASVLGRIRSLLFALPQARMLSDLLVKHLKKYSDTPWENKIPLEQQIIDQLSLSSQEIYSWKGNTFIKPLDSNTIVTDASDLGWGAIHLDLPPPQAQPLMGSLTLHHHINVKECMAAVQAIKIYNFRNTVLHLFTDSMNLCWYID